MLPHTERQAFCNGLLRDRTIPAIERETSLLLMIDFQTRLTRLRGLGVFSVSRPLPINGLVGKVCTTRGVWELCGRRSAVVAGAAN